MASKSCTGEGITDQYYFLSEDGELINGALNSILVNFRSRTIYQLNRSARLIIEFGEMGFTISEAAYRLNTDTSVLISFINRLCEMGLIVLSDLGKSVYSRTAIPPKLNFMWIEITSRCNLHCLHCYANSSPSSGSDLSGAEIKRLIDEAVELGCNTIQFTGGECTIREDLIDFIKYAKHCGVGTISVFTNGTLLTPSLIEYLGKANVSIDLSIYSHRPEIHDAITGIRGSHERTLKNLKLLQSQGLTVSGSVIVMKENEKSIDETISFINKLGILRRPPDTIRPGGRSKDLERWPAEYGQRGLIKEPNFTIEKSLFLRRMSWNSCWYGKLAVTCEGDVLPCVFARDLIIGNVSGHHLSEFIHGGLQKYWGLNNDHVEVCCDCEYRYLCFDCRPWAYGFTGNLYAKSPRCSYNPYTGEWGNTDSTQLYRKLNEFKRV